MSSALQTYENRLQGNRIVRLEQTPPSPVIERGTKVEKPIDRSMTIRRSQTRNFHVEVGEKRGSHQEHDRITSLQSEQESNELS